MLSFLRKKLHVVHLSSKMKWDQLELSCKISEKVTVAFKKHLVLLCYT